MNFNANLCGCNPVQILNLNFAVNDVSNLKIFDDCNNEYANSDLQYAYSLDGSCWSCYVPYNDIILNTIDMKQDFYVRLKVKGIVSKVELNGQQITDYTTTLDSGFNFTYCSSETSSNIYNPYANMDCAIKLQNYMADTVCCMFGIPIYYFHLNPVQGSKDITFKEYTLMNVDPPKQIKLMVQDGQMPSSRVEFAELGFDFQTDWETEISRSMFATAFGNTAQPMEGDFIWVPMMKRMWQVTGAWEEKNEGFMWISPTFKVTLAKYEEKGSINYEGVEDMVDSFIQNTYEELFGEDNEDTAGTGRESTEAPLYAPDNLIPIFKSDSTRKYVTAAGININDVNTYFKGTLISDAQYNFDTTERQIVYQKQYCGDDISISFIIKPNIGDFSGELLSIGSLKINIIQGLLTTTISVNKDPKLTVSIDAGNTYFIYIRWSKSLNIAEISSILYTYNQAIPIYKLQNHYYYYDVDNANTAVSKWNIEFTVPTKQDIILRNFCGSITNIKVYNMYNDNISEMIQMYPTNNFLLLNDTARKLVGLDGVKIH